MSCGQSVDILFTMRAFPSFVFKATPVFKVFNKFIALYEFLV